MEGLGCVLLLLGVYIIWRAQRDPTNKIDIAYLLVDSQTGNVTLAKWCGLVALLASTWVFVYMAVSNRFDTTFAIAYLGTWGAVKVAQDYFNWQAQANGQTRDAGGDGEGDHRHDGGDGH